VIELNDGTKVSETSYMGATIRISEWRSPVLDRQIKTATVTYPDGTERKINVTNPFPRSCRHSSYYPNASIIAHAKRELREWHAARAPRKPVRYKYRGYSVEIEPDDRGWSPSCRTRRSGYAPCQSYATEAEARKVIETYIDGRAQAELEQHERALEAMREREAVELDATRAAAVLETDVERVEASRAEMKVTGKTNYYKHEGKTLTYKGCTVRIDRTTPWRRFESDSHRVRERVSVTGPEGEKIAEWAVSKDLDHNSIYARARKLIRSWLARHPYPRVTHPCALCNDRGDWKRYPNLYDDEERPELAALGDSIYLCPPCRKQERKDNAYTYTPELGRQYAESLADDELEEEPPFLEQPLEVRIQKLANAVQQEMFPTVGLPLFERSA